MFRALNVTNVAKVLCKTGREPKSVYGLFYILKFERVVILFINSFFSCKLLEMHPFPRNPALKTLSNYYLFLKELFFP